MDTGLRGKTILITGAAGGIGQATARAFAEEGAQLILHYNTGLARAERLVEELGKPHVILQADLRDEGQVERLFSASLAEFPQLDCLVANAGIWAEAEVPLHEMSLEQWRQTMDGNLTSTFLTCRGFLRHPGHDDSGLVRADQDHGADAGGNRERGLRLRDRLRATLRQQPLQHARLPDHRDPGRVRGVAG